MGSGHETGQCGPCGGGQGVGRLPTQQAVQDRPTQPGSVGQGVHNQAVRDRV